MLVLAMMRAAVGIVLAVLAALAGAGCFTRSAALGVDDDDAGDDDAAPTACVIDTDCVGAGASCCGCPEYAVSATSSYAMACEDVNCPPPASDCSAVPRCDDGACVLACATVVCETTCPGGFAVDAAGCLACACSTDPYVPECSSDGDCVRVPADCCGCALGGADTAVPAGQETDHRDSLGCSGTPVCPGVDVCTPGETAQCEGGRCMLGTTRGALPPGACGTPDLAPCPAGQMCVLNSDGSATNAGVGVCQ